MNTGHSEQAPEEHRYDNGEKTTHKQIPSEQDKHHSRINIQVDRDVFKQFSAEAKRQNMTLFALTNELLGTSTKISSEGGDPSKLYELWRTTWLLKQFDVITLPCDLIDKLIATQYEINKENLLKVFRDLGSKLVGVLKMTTERLDELIELAEYYVELLPLKRFQVNWLRGGDGVEIRIVGAGRRIESTECTFELLQSILNGYGYDVARHEINVGTIMVLATKRNEK